MRKAFLALVLIVAALGLFASWEAFQFLMVPPGSSEQQRVFEVPPGSAFSQVASRLQSEGLVKNATYLKVLAKLKGQTTTVRVGEYALHMGMRPSEVLATISSGKSIAYPITIPEGANMYEIAQEVEARGFGTQQEFLALCRDPKLIQELLGENLYTLEGYLFPETYHLTKYTGLNQLVRMMVDNFNKAWAEAQSQATHPMDRHKAVTLASVIEKETGAAFERPLISSVFHNRLKKRMRLQSDPTILYGILDRTGNMKLNITKKDIHAKNRFNTYTIPALPFGPIANPGREALIAAVKPEPSSFYYFVSRNDGTHVFSKTYKEHNAAVRKFQLDRRAREGKSWRDLNKREEARK